jgi:DnaD/phage-associated family protein
MARYLDPKIMTDPWFIELDDRARLGWIMLILNGADDQGRFLMNGRLMKSMLFPADDLPSTEVLSMLESFVLGGKVHAYEKDGVRYGQIVKWWKYQVGSEWMAPSRHPAPESWVDRWRIHAKGGKGIIETSPHWADKKMCGFPTFTTEPEPGSPEIPKLLPETQSNLSGSSLGNDLGRPPGSHLSGGLPSSDVKVKEEVKDKGEGEVDNENEPPAGPAVFLENPFRVYEQNIGPLTETVSERIKLAEQDYPPGWVVDAIRLAARRNKRRWDYTEGILRSWQKDGKDDDERMDDSPLGGKTYAQELLAAGYTLPDQVPAGWLA